MPWLIAHRGAGRQAPENTIAAFEQALKYPIHGLETDVQMTKDGIPVLYHDRTLFKITKTRKRIADLTYQELCGLEWGKWFSPAFAKEPLLTLGELLRSYAHRTRLMIEIKSRASDRFSGRSFQLTRKVLHELHKPGLVNYRKNIFILSFDPEVLKLGHREAPEFNYVLNLSDRARDPTGYLSIQHADPLETHHLYALCVRLNYLSEKLVSFAHSQGKKVMTYVCNNAGQVDLALKFNADAVMTDDPQWITTHFIL